MEYLFVYLLQIADIWENILFLIIVSAFISVICTVLCAGFMLQDNVPFLLKNCINETERRIVDFFNFLKGVTISLVLISIVGAFVPTKQTLLLLGGTYLAKCTVNSSVVNAKLEKINTVIDLQLDKYIKELKEGQDE